MARGEKPKKPRAKSAKAPAANVARRRVPLQARSKERVARILDAAEHEFAEQGYEAATTEAIAFRAGTSIGSLYQFFPNKRALFDAIAERYLGGVEIFFADLIAQGAGRLSWPALMDATIDAFWAFARGSKAFRAVWIQGHFSTELLDASDALNRSMVARAEAVLAAYAPHLAPSKRESVATLIIEVTGIVLLIASRKKEPLATDLIEETKRLMRSYVALYSTPPLEENPNGSGTVASSQRAARGARSKRTAR